MKIIPFVEKYNSQWDEYVRDHTDGTFFHQTGWKRVIERAFGHEAHYHMVLEHDEIVGILPIFSIRSFMFGESMTSIPFAAYGGICADSAEIEKQLREKAEALTRQYNLDYLETRGGEKKYKNWASNDLYVTFIKEIGSDHDTNLKAIPRKQRAMVRKGIKAGLRSIISKKYLDDFYNIFAINVRNLGTPVYSKKWFKSLLDEFGNDVELMVIEYNGRIISGVLSFYYKDTVLPYYAASLAESRRLAPNDFQYWELMCHAVERGCRFFDYGRSKRGTGHFNFKKNWGFQPQPLNYQYYLNNISEVPAVNPLNPAYKRKIEAWKKLPLPLTKLIGPYIVKNIP